MKTFYALLLLFAVFSATAQKTDFIVHPVSLPPELSWYDNQFSGVAIHDNNLFLLSESRLQDKAEPKLYTVALTDIKKKIADSAFVLPYKKFRIENLELLRDKINSQNQSYEGLEAMAFDSNFVFLSVETSTPSSNCYILKGLLKDSSVFLYADYLVPLPKPITTNGDHIFNAGYEAITVRDHRPFAFFEYNYFPGKNKVPVVGAKEVAEQGLHHETMMARMPFRLTDITRVSADHYTAINYFYNGDGDDSIYREPVAEKKYAKLMYKNGVLSSYARLIDIKFSKYTFTWKPLWELPAAYHPYNWEGIAYWNGGYFLLNDKYTPKRPYSSVLLFLEKK